MAERPRHYFIGGIGGSGMLPLAVILKGMGHIVSGSDRSNDQGQLPEKFRWIAQQGIALYPQDGSGIAPDLDALVISKAVEDTVPDIVAAKAKGVLIRRRSDLLVECFNAAKVKIAVSGTSGKTTVTGMTGFLLREAGLDPTVMNGGVFRNYAAGNPYATAFVGKGDIFVTEVDESDGADAVAAYRPDIAILHNITLDHQPMDELKRMFVGFLASAKTAILNADDDNVMQAAKGFTGHVMTYSVNGAENADMSARNIVARPDGCDAVLCYDGRETPFSLSVPGRHNVSNALAALCAAISAGVSLDMVLPILSRFSGIRRRMEITGSSHGITVMDDFAHNPDKVTATLSALHDFPGRLFMFFQPHGYGFLKVVGPELAQSFAENMHPEDRLYLTEPFYAGGTVDRTVGSAAIVSAVRASGKNAYLLENRADFIPAVAGNCKSGDRIIVMGARDDTLSGFAASVLRSL